jgi:hypothetical protein
MRATILGIEVEGTLAEISALIREHGAPGGDHRVKPEEHLSNLIHEDERFASEKIAFRALNRRPLSGAQRLLFRTLFDAYPNWTSATRLQQATKYGPNQLGGLLGATGRRLSQTQGYVADSSMIEWMWDSDDNEYHYRLPPSVHAAVKRINP